MAKISTYPQQTTTISGTDELVGNVGGVTKRIPVNQLPSTGGGLTSGTPSSETDTGTAGQMKYDATNLYVCIATNVWRRLILRHMNPATLTYVSDGDANGAVYFAGTNYGTNATWTNPHNAGYATFAGNSNNTGGDLPASICDRATSHYSTGVNTGGGWVTVDFGAGRTLAVNKYSYRYRDDATTFAPTGWTLQGSNDNVTYTTVDTRSGQTPALNAWVSTTVTLTTAYRYWRIQMTGNNNSGTTQFSIGELELYGVLTY